MMSGRPPREDPPMSVPQPPTPPPAPIHTYPGGENAPAYRWAFTVWVVLFLLVVCAGLANYLGHYLKDKW
jgi:hypothetical protein